MKELPLSMICQLLEPGLLGRPRPRARAAPTSWRCPGTRWSSFQPSLIPCVVSNPRHDLVAVHATKGRLIAILALKDVAQIVGIGNRAGLNAGRFNSWRAAWPGASANGLEFWAAKPRLSVPLPSAGHLLGAESRMMFHVSVGTDLCWSPWRTES